MTGIVKSYNERKGFGFIQPLIGKPNETNSVFFHISTVISKGKERPAGLPVGAEVRFDLVRGERGPQAANVELVKVGVGSLASASIRGKHIKATLPRWCA